MNLSIDSFSSSSSIVSNIPANKFEPATPRRMSSALSLHSHLLQDEAEQERLQSLLKALQTEIQDLKYENSELKFLLFVALKHATVENPTQKNGFKWQMENFARDYFEETTTGMKTIRLELEATTNLLQESKWIQNHYEHRVREQELQIEDLQKQLVDMKNKEFTLLQLKLPTKDCRTSRRSNRSRDTSPQKTKTSGRQRSLSTTCQHRVQGLNSFLPDNYKEPVATLPPILDGRKHKTRQAKFWPQMKNVA